LPVKSLFSKCNKMDKSEIALLIDNLLEKCGITAPPVDLELIAQFQGASIDYVDLGSLLGSVSPAMHGPAIKLNEKQPDTWRFTLAHELGHTLLSRRLAGSRATAAARITPSKVEALCDDIGLELLMPNNMVTAFLHAKRASIASICDMAETFNCTVGEAAMRLAGLGNWPVEIACWIGEGDSLSLAWPKEIRLWRGWLDSSKRVRELSDESCQLSTIVRAYLSSEVVFGYESPTSSLRFHKYACEAKGFGDRENRHVISLFHLNATEAQMRAQAAASARWEATRRRIPQ
jgi:hypothetical protein